MKAYGLARLGRDAELRTTQTGESVARLSLAFSYGKKGADGKRPTEWVEGSLWGQRAQALAPYLRKGSQIVVTLEELHIEHYTRNDGSQAHKLAARVADVELAGEPRAAAAPAPVPPPAPVPQPVHAAPLHPNDFDCVPF